MIEEDNSLRDAGPSQSTVTVSLREKTRVKCLDCQCIGRIRKSGDELFLCPDEVLTTRNIVTQKTDLQKPATYIKSALAKLRLADHGNATSPQFGLYMALGTLFWGSIILSANFINAAQTRQKATFLTNTCQLGYKRCLRTDTVNICGDLLSQCFSTREFQQPEPVLLYQPDQQKPLIFNEKDNKFNLRRCKKKQFYDAMLCRHLCSMTLVLESTRSSSTNSCKEICTELTKSSKLAGEICPYQKYCENGCPCQNYACEKITEKDQEEIPVWDLESKTSGIVDNENSDIFGRRKDLWRTPRTHSFDVKLFDHSKYTTARFPIDNEDFFPH